MDQSINSTQEISQASTEQPTSQSVSSTPETTVQSTGTDTVESLIAKKEKSATETPVQAAPKYEPKLKYSFTDPTGQKKEETFDEMFKSIIDSEEKEKKVKELYEKAAGIDFIKADRTKLSQDYQSYKAQAEPLFEAARQIEYHRQKGDLTSVLAVLGYKKEDLINHAVELVKLENLPENQKRVYDQNREAEWKAYELERQLADQANQFQQFKVQQRSQDLDSQLSRPEVAQIVQSFDQENGPGSFRNEIIQRGQMYWHTQGVDKPAGELVDEIVNRFGKAYRAQPQAQVAPPQAATPKAPSDLPVIPNTGAGTQAPVKKKITSLKDIEAEYQSL